MPATSPPPVRWRAYREMKALSPTKTIERHTMAPDIVRKARQSSLPARRAAADAVAAAVTVPLTVRSAAPHRAAPARAGTTSSGEARRPPVAMTAETISGAAAKPMLPPRENRPMALWLPRLAIRAIRAASGW